MSLPTLPYELVIQITSFLHHIDIVNLATTCSHIHSYLKARLEIHRRKLATLSTVHDRDQHRTTSLLLKLFSRDATFEDAGYVRNVIIGSYHSTTRLQDQPLNDIIPRPSKWMMTIQECISNFGRFWGSIFIEHEMSEFFRAHDRSQHASELILVLALLRMPRLSKVRIALHPSHGHYSLYERHYHNSTGNSMFSQPYVPPSQIFIIMLDLIVQHMLKHDLLSDGLPMPWPPGLQSLRSIELDTEELHQFYRHEHGWSLVVSPRVHWRHLRPFLHLPNLVRLLVNNNNSVLTPDTIPGRWGASHEPFRRRLDVESPIEELVLIGFGGWQEYVRLMIESIKRLRVLVLCRRGDEGETQEIIETLRAQHGEWLERLILPSHTSNALSWCQGFPRLKELTVSYVDVMAAFRRQQIHLSTPEGHGSRSEPFHLADSLPADLEILTFIGGRQSSTVTSVRAIPLYTDIQDFLNIVILLISTKGSGPASRRSQDRPGNLREICFGDMRIAVVPENEVVGKTLHQSQTKAREIARLRLNHEIEKSVKLKEVCGQSGVRIHITDLKKKVCDHPSRHAYTAKKRSSRQELIEEADRLSEDADYIVQNTLAQYVNSIPRKYRP